jgi:hypothetical protein
MMIIGPAMCRWKWFATIREQIHSIREFFRYLAGVKNQIQQLYGLQTSESFVASL